VLRPGGALVLSVPAAGPLAGLDSLNLYARLARRLGWLGLASDESGASTHRHFRPEEIARCLPDFTVQRMARTGVGLGEPANLALLVTLRGLARWERSYRVARFLGFALTILDDLIPAGPLGYNLYLRLRKGQSEGRGEEGAWRLGQPP
jgi:hypothetical protein